MKKIFLSAHFIALANYALAQEMHDRSLTQVSVGGLKFHGKQATAMDMNSDLFNSTIECLLEKGDLKKNANSDFASFSKALDCFMNLKKPEDIAWQKLILSMKKLGTENVQKITKENMVKFHNKFQDDSYYWLFLENLIFYKNSGRIQIGENTYGSTDCFQKAIKLDNNAFYWYSVATRIMDDCEDSLTINEIQYTPLTALEKAILCPHNGYSQGMIWEKLILMMHSLEFYKEEEITNEENLARIYKKNKGNAYFWLYLDALIFSKKSNQIRIGENTYGSTDCFQRAIRLDENNAFVWYCVAKKIVSSGKKSLTINNIQYIESYAIEKAISLNSRSSLFWSLAAQIDCRVPGHFNYDSLKKYIPEPILVDNLLKQAPIHYTGWKDSTLNCIHMAYLLRDDAFSHFELARVMDTVDMRRITIPGKFFYTVYDSLNMAILYYKKNIKYWLFALEFMRKEYHLKARINLNVKSVYPNYYEYTRAFRKILELTIDENEDLLPVFFDIIRKKHENPDTEMEINIEEIKVLQSIFNNAESINFKHWVLASGIVGDGTIKINKVVYDAKKMPGRSNKD